MIWSFIYRGFGCVNPQPGPLLPRSRVARCARLRHNGCLGVGGSFGAVARGAGLAARGGLVGAEEASEAEERLHGGVAASKHWR